MSCEEVKIINENNTIQILDNKNIVKVVDQQNKIDIIDNKDVVEINEGIGEKVVINATDTRFSIVQSIDIDMECTSAEQIGDAVYVSGNGAVSRANATSIATAEVFGFVVTKSGDNNCKVRTAGFLGGFSGILYGQTYFLDISDGQITTIAPTASGNVVFAIATGLDESRIRIITSNRDLVIRS